MISAKVLTMHTPYRIIMFLPQRLQIDFFLVLFIFSCRYPLPVVSPSCFISWFLVFSLVLLSRCDLI